MIKNCKELKRIIKLEKKKYQTGNFKRDISKILVKDKDIEIFKFQKYLRKSEYHYNQKSIIHKLLYIYYRRKKNIIGNKLGIEIWENTFDEGLKIWHAGSIIINGEAKIGKNCELKGDNCIGNDGKSNLAPRLGDNVSLGNGAKIIGNIEIGNNVTIGAGAVVTKSFKEDNIILVGVPAKKI